MLDKITPLDLSLATNKPTKENIKPLDLSLATVPSSTNNLVNNDLYGYNFQNIDRYKRFIDEIYPNVNLERQAATNQSAWGKIGNMFVQGGVGEILAEGLIGGVGSIFELPDAILDEIAGRDADFSNFMTKFADNINEEMRESAPIFRYNPNKAFDWKDLGWWTNNGVSVFSTVGLLIPALGEVKIAGYFGKALRKLSAISRLNKLNTTSKIIRGVSDVFDTERYWQKLTHSAIAMRNAENMRESSQAFNSIRNEALTLFQNDEEYQKVLNSEIGQEFLKEGRVADKAELANFIASKGAWKNYGMNAGNLVFDMMQLAPLFKGFKATTRATFQPAKAVAYQTKTVLETAGKNTAKTAALPMLSFLQGAGIMVREQVSEGAEELVNAISQSDANWYGKHLLTKEKDKDFNERLSEYLRDPSSWEQAFWGFMGGVAFSGATRGYKSLREVMFDEKDPHSANAKIEEIKNRFLIIGKLAGDINLIKEGIHPETKVKLAGSEIEINNAKQVLTEKVLQTLGYSLGLNASRHSNVDMLLDMIKHPNFKEKFIATGITDETNFDKTLDTLTKNILDAEETYKQVYAKIFTDTDSKPWIREALLGQAVSAKNDIEYNKRKYQQTKDEVIKLKNNSPAYASLKDTNKDKDFDGTLENIINAGVIEQIDSFLNAITNPITKSVLSNRAEEFKTSIREKTKELKDKEATGDFTSIQDIIDKEVEARLYETFVQADNAKFENVLNTTKSIPETEKKLEKEKEEGFETQFRTFKNKINEQIELDKGKKDTQADIDNKVKIIDDFIDKIKKSGEDPFAKEGEPFKKLDKKRLDNYIKNLENSKQLLIQEKNRRASQEADLSKIAETNKELSNKLAKVFKVYGISGVSTEFTGKRHEAIIRSVAKGLQESALGKHNIYSVLIDLVEGKEITNEEMKFVEGKLSETINYFTKNKAIEEFINEILLTLGYITEIDFQKELTTATGTTQHLENAKNFRDAKEAEKDQTKPAIDFTTQNPLKPTLVDRANKWITDIINDTPNGEPLFNEFDNNGKPKNTFFKFESIAARYAELVGAEEFKNTYEDLKDAYEIISNSAINPETKTTRKYNTRNYIDKISADSIINKYNISTPYNQYEITNSELIEKTGGTNITNTYVFSREITVNRDENGNLVVDNDEDAETLRILMSEIQQNSKVTVKVNTEYKGEKGFSQNKNNPNSIPLVVSVETKNGSKNIASINTIPTTHKGVKYNFDGTDWIDKFTKEVSSSNSRLVVLQQLFGYLQNWFNANKFTTGNEANKALDDLIEADKFGLIYDLIGRDKDIKSKEGKDALTHITNVLFFGQSDTGTFPTNFDRKGILQNVYNWKDKLYRDHINNTKIRNTIGTNTEVKIDSKISYITSGSVIIAEDKNGNKVYNNLAVVAHPKRVKLFRLSTNEAVVENTRNSNETVVKKSGSFSHALYVGLTSERDTGTPGNTIVVPLFRNTLGGHLLSSNNSNDLVSKIFELITAYGKSRVNTAELTNQSEKDSAHVIESEMQSLIEQVLVVYHTGIAKENILDLSYKEAKFVTEDKQGRKQTIIYNFYENSFKYQRKENNTTIEKEITEEEFKQELSKLNRTVNYKNFKEGKYRDILGNLHDSYEEYLISTNSVVTDIGMVTDKNGKKISNFMPTNISNKGGLPLVINIDTSNLTPVSKRSGTFGEFSTKYKLDTRFDFVFSLFDNFISSGEIKFNGITAGQHVNRFGWYDPATKSISIGQKWVEQYKKDPTSATLLLVHEILHGLIGTRSKEDQVKFRQALQEFQSELKESEAYKALINKTDKTDIDNKIIAIINDKDSEELLTYGLTDTDFAKFLDSVKSTKNNITVSFWTKLKDLIRQIAQSFGVSGTKLDELTSLFDSFINNKPITGINKNVKLDEDWDFGDSDIDVSDKFVSYSSITDFTPQRDLDTIKFSSYASSINQKITGSPFTLEEERNILNVMTGAFIEISDAYKDKKLRDISDDQIKNDILSNIGKKGRKMSESGQLSDLQKQLLFRFRDELKNNDRLWKLFRVHLASNNGIVVNDIDDFTDDIEYIEKSWEQEDVLRTNPILSVSNLIKNLINTTAEIDPNNIQLDENGEYKFVNDTNTPTGFANFLNYNELHNKLVDLMKGSLSKQEMLDRLFDFATNSKVTTGKSLLKVWQRLKQDEQLLNTWFTTYDKAITESYRDLHREVDVKTEYGSNVMHQIDIDHGNRNSFSYIIANQWANTIISRAENGIFNKQWIENWDSDYKELSNETRNFTIITDTSAEKLSKLFDKIGINISAETILYYYNKNHTNILNTFLYHLQYIKSDPLSKKENKGYIELRLANDKRVFDQFGRLRELADLTKFLRIDHFSHSSINTKGNMIHDPRNPSFISKFFKILQSNDETVVNHLNKYAKVLSNQHSFILWGDHIQDGEELNKGRGILNYSIENGIKIPLKGKGAINKENLAMFRNILYEGSKDLNNNIATEYKDLAKYDWTLKNLLYYFGEGTYQKNKQGEIIGKKSAFMPLINPSDRGHTMMFEAPIYELDNRQATLILDPNIPVDKKLEELRKLPIFKAIYNSVLDEMIAMNVAKKVLFKTDSSGSVIFDGNTPILNDQIRNDEVPTQLFYHYKFDENGNKIYLKYKVNEFNNIVVDTENSGNIFELHNISVIDKDRQIKFNNIKLNGISFTQQLMNSRSVSAALNTPIENGTTFGYALETFILRFMTQQYEVAVKNLGIYKDYINSSYIKDLNKKGDIINILRNKDFRVAVFEYALNTYLFNSEQIRLFYGSIADYKSAIDVNKRGGQVLANGISNSNEGIYYGATISDVKLKSKVYDHLLRTTANALDSTKKYNNKKLSKIYTDEELENNIPKFTKFEKELYNIVSPYLQNDSANGVSLITFNEFIKRVKGFGLYHTYKDLIEKIQKGEELNKDEIFKFASIQKNFYYSLDYYSDLGKMLPNQVKNSEIVLTPALIKDLELERLNKLMIDNGLSQLNLESAEKIGSLYIAKINNEDGYLLDDEIVKNELIKAKRPYEYNGLVMQQEAVDHTVDEVNTFGRQISKKIIENISDNTIYNVGNTEITGKQLKNLYFNLYSSNIWESANQTLLAFNTVVNSKGELVNEIDYDKLVEILEKQAIERGFTKNLVYSLQIGDNGYAKVPIFFNPVSSRWENLLTSIITNGVSKQTFPGVHAIQMSSLFMNKQEGVKQSDLTSTEGINWHNSIFTTINSKGNTVVRKDNKLRSTIILDNTEKQVIEAEVLLPRWSKYFIGENKDINNLSEEIRTMIAYRIPTEAKYSMYIFKVVGFLPDDNGPAIVLPDEFITQTGADFDWDTVFTMLYNLKSNTIKTDTGKSTTISRIEYIDGNTETDLEKRVDAIMNSKSDLKHILSQNLSIDKVVSAFEMLKDRDSEIDKLNQKISASKGKTKQDLIFEKYELQSRLYTSSGPTFDNTLTNYKDDLVYINIRNTVKSIISDWSIEDQNTRRARENKIVDIYYSILTNPAHFLETINIQSFSDITNSRDKINKILFPNKRVANNLTFDGQQEYRDKSQQGRNLKGRSIAFDRFNSIAQVAGMSLSNSIHENDINIKNPEKTLPVVEYELNDIYNEKELKRNYGKDIVIEERNGKKYAIITHRFIGNNPSGTFKNVLGKFINAYSAQTTANILDNVAHPLPNNVNEYTIPIWKMLPTIGSTYDIATSLINQPIIRELTNFWFNNQHSIKRGREFEEIKRKQQTLLYKVIKKRTGKGIESADKDISAGKTIFIPASSNAINFFYNYFGYKNDIPIRLNEEELLDNINVTNESEINSYLTDKIVDDNRLEQIEKHLRYQLQILETFRIYKQYAQSITDAVNIFNTDRLGAGPRFDTTNSFEYSLDRFARFGLIKVGNTNAAIAVYPKYFGAGHESVYLPLESFYIFANRLSIKAFTNNFIGETDIYKYIKREINDYIDQVRYDKKLGDRITKYLTVALLKDNSWLNDISIEEKQRILGINTEINLTLDVNNVDNIWAFEELSIANQVRLLKEHKNYSSNHIINFLNTELRDTDIERNGYHNINYINNDIPDTMTESFNELWYSDNIFERIVARNLVKYEYLTNGFIFGFNSFAKIIPNNIFELKTTPFSEDIDSDNESGINISDHLYGKLRLAVANKITDDISHEDIKKFSETLFGIDYFDMILRTNWTNDVVVPDASVIKESTWLTSKDKEGNEVKYQPRVFSPDKNGIISVPARKWNGINTSRNWNNVKRSRIIKLYENKDGKAFWVLFRRIDSFVNVEDNGTVTGTYYYYPVNKLMEHETTDSSIVPQNNQLPNGSKIQDKEYYLKIIDQLHEQQVLQSKIIGGYFSYNIVTFPLNDNLKQYNNYIDPIRDKKITGLAGNIADTHKKGDILQISGFSEYVKVTKDTYPIDLTLLENRKLWSKLTGFDISNLHKTTNYKGKEVPFSELPFGMTEFEYIGNTKETIEKNNLTLTNNSENQDEDVENVIREYTPNNITSLKSNEIFVFGSNTEGRHGLGAAKTALDKFGAIYGQSKGLQGQSYAIITKNLAKGKRSIPLSDIKTNIEEFNQFAYKNPDLKFYVTKLGTFNAGYSISEIRSLFSELNEYEGIADNIILPKEYEIRGTNEQLSLKFSSYASSSNETINNVINNADEAVKKIYGNIANLIKISSTNKQAKDLYDTLKSLGIEREINQLSLANFATGLSAILKYSTDVLLMPPTEKYRGGILPRLNQYENTDIKEILSDPIKRREFTNFMSMTLSFLKGWTVATELTSVDGDNYTNEEKVINSLVKELQKLNSDVLNAKKKFDSLLEHFYEAELINYTTNPDIIDGLRKIFDPGDDENYAQLQLDALSDTNNSFVANMIKKYIVTISKAEKQSRFDISDFEDLLVKTFNKPVTSLTPADFVKYLETVEGKLTGKLIQKYDWNKYYADKKAYFTHIIKTYGRGSDSYINASRAWFRDNEVVSMSDEEVEAVRKQKEEELSSTEYKEWIKRNFYKRGDTTYVKVGDSMFSVPSDKYINPAWVSIKDDPIYNALQDIISKYLDYFGKKTILNEGFIPSMKVSDKESLTLSQKIEAWIESKKATKKSDSFVGQNDELVYILTIPMIQKFGTREEIKFRDKKFGEKYEEYEKAVLKEISQAGKGEFKSLNDVKEENKKIREENNKEHAGKINYNLYEVFSNFIKEANLYKAKKSIKHEYDLALYQIQQMDFVKRDSKNNLLTNKAASKTLDKKVIGLKKGAGTNLEKHFSEWLEAIFYGNFDVDEGTWTQISKILLQYSSAKNMWFNITAGVNNVVFGKMQIRLESIAGWYFKGKDLQKADAMYIAAIPDMFVNLGKLSAGNLTNAIIKLLDISQNTNERDYTTGMLKASLKSSSSMYFMNDIGEHYMQNVNLLAMMNHHRIVNGEIMSLAEYSYYNYKKALHEILSAEEKEKLESYLKVRYEKEEFKESKKDYLRDFLLTLPINKSNAFIEAKKKLDTTSSTEFESHPKLIDAFYLNDKGIAEMKDEIEINGKKYSTKLKENEFELFRSKALKVVQKEQGIYNTEDANLLSRRALGKMLMQFRKYMRPGWNKRFGSKFGRSFWTESRDEWDKGSYVSLFNFLRSAGRRARFDETGKEVEFRNMMSRIIGDFSHFITNIGVYWNTLDDYEKGNVKRAAREMAYLCCVLAIGMILKGLKPDDDDDKDYAYDFTVYQVDRLLSEVMMYTPFGLINEGQKILKSPAAVQGALLDMYKFISSTVAYPLQSDEKRLYQSGIYRGEAKVKINAVKLVPVLNKIQALKRLDKFNKYYILFRG